MPKFFQTMMGKDFYQNHVPSIVKEMKKISEELNRANDLKEKELKIKELELSLKIKEKNKGGFSNV